MAEKPFKAYSGNEPFIFVSYAHSDDELVYPELERLRQLGYNVWYDEGLEAGKDWTAQLAQRLSDCALVVYYVTPNAALSRHCGNEIHYALDLEKPMLVIHLAPAMLSPGQRLQLGSMQAIIKHELTAQSYQDKLESALGDLMVDTRVESGKLPDLPMGMVTLLRLDVVGAHELAMRLGHEFDNVLSKLRELARGLSDQRNGFDVEISGDVCMFAFTDAVQAVKAAIDIQKGCAAMARPQGNEVQVRMGLHTGQPRLVRGQYFGVDVQRAVQIADIGSGGQVILSADVLAQVADSALPPGVAYRKLGSHRLKNMPYPEVLHDLQIQGLDCNFPPIASLTNRPSNIPRALSSFVGRVEELSDICRLLRDEPVRVLTLTGPGGTGKSRLSLEAANKLEADFPDGVYLVKLSAVTDDTLVIPTIAETLGVKEMPGQSILDSLIHRLHNSRVLLVMDNFEQIIEGAASLPALLDGVPEMKILVSSREPLLIRGEQEYQLEPLQLPHRDPAKREQPLEDIESIKLFLDRVREYRRDFTLSEDNAEAVAALCIQLDGLPLALELAAARLTVLSPQALLQSLSRSLDVLKAKSRDLPERQKTLSSTVAWSYDLLEPEEQALFRLLSVFRGGFSLSSAEIVLEESGSAIDLLDGIESLTKKSLLKHDPEQLEPRFWMLETIREYGRAQAAASNEDVELRKRHADHFLELAESLAPGITSRGQRVCVTRMLADGDNIRAAMEWYLEQGDVSRLTRCFQSLWWFWIQRGKFTEGFDWTRRALEAFSTLPPSRDKGLIYETIAWLEALAGDYAAAIPNLDICHQIYSEHGDQADIGRVSLSLGLTRTTLGMDGGDALCQVALTTFESNGDSYYYGLSLISSGIICLAREDVAGAAAAWQQALGVFREYGNSFWPAQILINLAHFQLLEGDWKAASELVLEAQALASNFDYPMISNLALLAMGGVLVVRQQYAEAARMFGALSHSLEYLGVTLEPLEIVYQQTYTEQVRQHLDESEYDSEFRLGQAWGELDAQNALQQAANN